MNAALLVKILGKDQSWHGPCTVIMQGEAAVTTQGLVDSLLGGGTKQYAPRVISGRVVADAVCLLPEIQALLILQQQKIKASTGDERVQQLLTIADISYIMAIEFQDTGALAVLGVPAPMVRTSGGSHHGTSHRPI
jgi:hypothetical protein